MSRAFGRRGFTTSEMLICVAIATIVFSIGLVAVKQLRNWAIQQDQIRKDAQRAALVETLYAKVGFSSEDVWKAQAKDALTKAGLAVPDPLTKKTFEQAIAGQNPAIELEDWRSPNAVKLMGLKEPTLDTFN